MVVVARCAVTRAARPSSGQLVEQRHANWMPLTKSRMIAMTSM